MDGQEERESGLFKSLFPRFLCPCHISSFPLTQMQGHPCFLHPHLVSSDTDTRTSSFPPSSSHFLGHRHEDVLVPSILVSFPCFLVSLDTDARMSSFPPSSSHFLVSLDPDTRTTWTTIQGKEMVPCLCWAGTERLRYTWTHR